MSAKVSCFVAYPSKPPSLAETIEEAIEKLKLGQVLDIDGWKSTSTTGKFIMIAICQEIDRRDIFICDLTGLNHNVLFELGYAIARKKRIWLLLDPSIQKSRVDYEKFKLLTTVGYSRYTNSDEIVEAFYKEEPNKDFGATIYRDAIESVIKPREKPTLLYLKSAVETNASIKLSRTVASSKIQAVVDDPSEVGTQTLSWYVQEVYSAWALIAHFLSKEQRGWRFHNAKYSFVSGLAYGFAKPPLMLVPDPYESPIDYRDLLKVHKTATECEREAAAWLDQIERQYAERDLTGREYAEDLRARSELQNMSIGDPVAEHESEALVRYFIVTAAYNEALASKHCIFVGRKGSGKTAILYKLADEIGSSPNKHVCVIKPVAYELEGILRMLQQALPTSERGYLVESFWKFLIYTELAKTILQRLESSPPAFGLEKAEEELLSFVEDNSSIITGDFSIRLETVVSKLQNLTVLSSAGQQRARISELLHENVIKRLRLLLGRALEKKKKVAILIDNLDKAWNQGADLRTLCHLLLGLLAVARRITEDFQKSDHWRPSVDLSLIVFLRSDIFGEVIKTAPERDKIPYSRITWDDSEVLVRVLEERFMASHGELSNPMEVWSRYFCASVNGAPTKDYLVQHILPRPRDLIYLCKAAIAQAINRGHAKVESEDILEAQKKYSQYALDSVVVENGIRIKNLEELLYEFVAVAEVVSRDDILQAMTRCKIPRVRLGEVVELLCDLTFLGREVEMNRFEFLYNENDKTKFEVMARNTATARPDKVDRFRINQPFHAYLEIVPMAGRPLNVDQC